MEMEGPGSRSPTPPDPLPSPAKDLMTSLWSSLQPRGVFAPGVRYRVAANTGLWQRMEVFLKAALGHQR